ncbi:hypothetical protein DV738_g5218, partial [Chaetothyriales sp. CBS 135597]
MAPRLTQETSPTAREGLQAAPEHKFVTIKKLNQTLDEEAGKASPSLYLIFNSVTKADLNKIERARERGQTQRSLRLTTHYEALDLLIIKVPTSQHDVANEEFKWDFQDRITAMNLRPELRAYGTTKYQGRGVSKEADAAYRPFSARPPPPHGTDWPTLVIETGWSESLARLRVDAQLWLANSGGDVRTVVVLIAVCRTSRRIIIEKWEPVAVSSNRQITRSMPTATPTATPTTRVQHITIEANSVTGAPLILDFEKIFLRQPVPPQEHDLIFTQPDLSTWAEKVWGTG